MFSSAGHLVATSAVVGSLRALGLAYVVTNSIRHLDELYSSKFVGFSISNFERSVLLCTSYGARPQARAVNLSLASMTFIIPPLKLTKNLLLTYTVNHLLSFQFL